MPVRGAHGGAISALAVTADGRAAVSGDPTGGLRLWPTLDGTREPIAITAPTAMALAIARDGSGFAIAVTDVADHVELVRVDARGEVRSRRRLGAAVQVAAAGEAVLAMRADHVIDQIALDGTPRGRLAAEPGTRIESLVVRDRTAFAIERTAKAAYARALELEPLGWARRSAALPLAVGTPVVLTADATGLVAVAARGDRVSRFDLATGEASPACPTPSSPRHLGTPELRVEPLGIVGDRVACLIDGVLSWSSLGDGSRTTAEIPGDAEPVFAAGGDRIVVGTGQQLAIHVPGRVEYLGYGVRELAYVRPLLTGLMIGRTGREPLLLDERFRERARFTLRPEWTDVVRLDDRYLVATSVRPGGDDPWGSGYQIAVHDSLKQVDHQVLPHRARSGTLVYDPATRLLVASEGTQTLLMRVDLDTHTIGDEIRLDLPGPPKGITLVDPALAGGLVAIAHREDGFGSVTVYELDGRDLPPHDEAGGPRTLRVRRAYRLASGGVRAIDRAGRLYVAAEPGSATTIRVGTEVIATLPYAHVRPSPDGKHVAAVGLDGRVALYTAHDGRPVWETIVWGHADVAWTPAGMLYVRFPDALARIEVATGALADRQCGWAFGISPTPHPHTAAAPSVCDAP